MGTAFFKSEGATGILGPSNKKVGAQAPPAPPVPTPMSFCDVLLDLLCLGSGPLQTDQ